MICFECKKEIIGEPIVQEPNRGFLSPSSSVGGIKDILSRFPSLNSFIDINNYYERFCSKECQDNLNTKRYIWFAVLDQNASDSECFEHIGWKKDDLHRNIRVGRCKITGQKVEVEPLQPGDNSGQPIECYNHFKLRKNYSEKIEKLKKDGHIFYFPL